MPEDSHQTQKLMDFVHSLEIIPENCCGRLSCMRVCPTQAIRVRNGKAQLDPVLCIDCGECIVACPEQAIKSRTDSISDINRFSYKVAIPSLTLFSQFLPDITPADIIDCLKSLGFDDVYLSCIEGELINRAIRDYLTEYKGPYPLISLSCPVVVRLLQVAYPEMVRQIVPIQPRRDIAAREMKKTYSKKLGLPEDEIGAIYITPCPAKMIAIKQPAEQAKGSLDLALGISEIYNSLLTEITRNKQKNKTRDNSENAKLQSRTSLSWALSGGQSLSVKPSRYLIVEQMPNIIKIFDDVEKGKIRDVEFLECYACFGGCIGGPLLVDDMFVSRGKLQKLMDNMEDSQDDITNIVNDRYTKGDYF
ncbi:4Fe-4S binding protein, partial [bacterium]|nr:4Fe-4S binding protein [bacterium]MBU1025979.1 4Fe-4S binding protein [bacterium]